MSVMVTPTFNLSAIFGTCWKMRAYMINPRATQVNTYPGQSGLETLDQGRRGARTEVEGRHGGFGIAGLYTQQNNFRSFYDGNAYILKDQFGVNWPYVKLDSFQQAGPITLDQNTGWLWQPYRATFIHLV